MQRLSKKLLGTIILTVFRLEFFHKASNFPGFGQHAFHKLLETVFRLAAGSGIKNQMGELLITH